ncbi:helix-turn-helix domain-containing protein [Kitasatospora kazusensis]|uniref:Helix-turn-helix domain-containing protein n=1 Tax=Kitasatospora kazusensis TaxID=407974 RepID=A0ABP5LG20_9ACTN
MPTLGWLTGIPELELAFAPGWAERAATRPVTGAAELPAGRAPGPELAELIVRAEPQDTTQAADRAAGGRADRRLRGLAAVRVAALAVPGPVPVPAALAEAAVRHGVPLLTVGPEVCWARVARLVDAERLREARHQLRLYEELLGHARDQGPQDRRVERLVDWLARAIGGCVTLSGPAPAAAPPTAWHQLAASAAAAAEVSKGRLDSAALDDGGLGIRLTAVGRTGDGGGRPVLTVGLPAPFDPQAGALVTRAAELLAPLIALRRAETDRDRLAEVAADLRVGVFQLLMGGEVTLAQRAAEGLARGLLDTATARVYVLEGPADERDALARACGAATEGRALVVRCPATEQHLIVVAPLEDPAGPARDEGPDDSRDDSPNTGPDDGPGSARDDSPDDGWDVVGLTLRRFAAGHPQRFLGGSGPLPPAQTAGAYGDAVRALAVARLAPGRAALYTVESRLTQVLDAPTAARWAAEVLRPLHAVPLVGRDQLLGTLHLGLEFPATSAGKILGVSRNTVRARLDRAAGLLGLDLSEVLGRAVLHLALRVGGSGSGPAGPGPVALTGLLAGEGARGWAAGLLGRLEEDGRGLRGTLLGWLTANTGVERAAERLGLHPQTVRDHLRGAERLLQRQLLSGGGGVYEVALAFAALGELELPQTVHP